MHMQVNGTCHEFLTPEREASSPVIFMLQSLCLTFEHIIDSINCETSDFSLYSELLMTIHIKF